LGVAVLAFVDEPALNVVRILDHRAVRTAASDRAERESNCGDDNDEEATHDVVP
jgi:hypothetical protein